MSSKVSNVSGRKTAKAERPVKSAAKTNKKPEPSVFPSKDRAKLNNAKAQAQKDAAAVQAMQGEFIDIADSLNISPFSNLDINLQNYTEMVQSNLYNLIRCFEGNAENNYKPYNEVYKDKKGTRTTGFGEVSNKAVKSEAEAYFKMIKKLKSFNDKLKRIPNFNQLPASIREGLLDLAYNKGDGVITSNKELLAAIQNNDYSTIVKNLLYQYSVKDDNKKDPIPGLYRRSFNRAAMACRDLQGLEYLESINEVLNMYDESKKCFDEKKEKTTDINNELKHFISNNFNKAISNYKNVQGNDQAAFNEIKKFYEKIKEYGLDNKELEQEYKALEEEYNAKQTAKANSNSSESENADNKSDNSEWAKTAAKIALIPAVVNMPGFIAGMALANLTKSAINGIKSWFNSDDIEYTFDENASVMANMLNDKSVQKEEDGDFQIVTVDYEVQKGNNLYRIGLRYGTTDNILANNNDIEDKNLIKENQIVKIQKLGYKVKKGDTIESIAKKFDVSEDVLKDINNIDEKNPISKNQIIEIPGLLFKAKKEGTLDKIAEKAGVTVEKLMEINGLKENKIKEGDIIKVVSKNPIFTVPSNFGDIKNYPLLQKPMKDDKGRIVATRKVFEPTHKGPLSGKTIIINAGHGYKETGRIDCGADYSSNSIPDEWIVNHRNALELTERLRAQGAKVIFMQGFRSLVVNEFSKKENKADLFISLHANAAGQNAKDRTQFYCYEDVKDKNNKQKSIKLSEMAEQKFNSWIPQNEQIVETDKFYSHKKAVYAESKITNKRVGILNCAINKLHSPAMLWEVGFGTSKKGAERLNDEELMENYMKLMTETIVEFFQK